MIKRILLVIVLTGCVLGTYILFFEKEPELPAPPERITDVLPADLKQVVMQDKEAEKAPTPEPAAVADPEKQLVTITGDGLAEISMQVVNTGAEPAKTVLAAGTQLESGPNRVMTIEDVDLVVEPGQTERISVPCVSLRISNQQGYFTYQQTASPAKDVDALYRAAKGSGQVADTKLLQTAAILVNDDPRLHEIADFPTVDESEIGANTEPSLKGDAAMLLKALLLAKDAGIDISTVSIVSDPQLKLETMVKPETHDMAKSLYALDDRRREWAFWKGTLERGDIRLKHYALYGIGRYFPEVAVEMMPAWITNARISPVYRLSAIYALAYSGSPEASAKLTELEAKFPESTNMGKATRQANRYLRSRI